MHIRKPVTEIKTEADFNSIADAAVRAAVRAKFEEVGRDTRKYAENPPRMPSGVPIKRVRIRKIGNTVAIGEGANQRNVISGSNHHMEMIRVLGVNGQVSGYKAVVVSRLEANLRHREGLPVVLRDHGPGTHFLFSLSEGDMVEYRKPGEEPRICRVRGVTKDGSGRIELCAAEDARLKADMQKSDSLYRVTASVFLRCGGKKVRVDHLGQVVAAND